MKNYKKTIFALSTPWGKSATALIRLSGAESHKCIKEMSSNMPTKQNIATFNKIKTIDGDIIDHSVTTFFKAPKSYTGEDMVELSIHGGTAIINKIFSSFAENPKIRPAKPGEFTRRAFENNKLDLTQVEAIADVIAAETEMQRKQALRHLSGDFYKSTKDIHEKLKKILANTEATIDFSEEDLPDNMVKEIKEQIRNIIKEMKKTISNASTGISIRGGFLIAVLGKTNSGKSSFINKISGRDIAIVNEKPGTTRDILESFLDVGGYPIKFLDTAGIRRSLDEVEQIGIKKAYLASEESNFNLVFIEKKEDIKKFKDIKNPVFVRSKQDINGGSFVDSGFYNISSKNNFGIKNILEVVKNNIKNQIPNEGGYISRERQVGCIKRSIYHLEKSRETKTIDLFAEDIRVSLKNLSGLFGNVDIEDILDIIFSEFCIGK